MTIAVIGLGLIGGSMALDLKTWDRSPEVVGFDNEPAHLEKAIQLGIVNREGTQQDLKTADVVILAVPVNAASTLAEEVLNQVADHTLVFDVGSTKAKICKHLNGHRNRRNFLAAHPIAGTEFSGPEAAVKDLFRAKTNIICEVEKTAFTLQEKALEIFDALGMRIRYMDPLAHDKHIAYVSHLSHISSFMLGKTVIEKEKMERDIFDMAGSGFESTVRLAKSSPAMWTPIFSENRDHVLETLTEYIQNLEQFKDLLEKEDYQGIYREMENTNKIKDILKGMTLPTV